MAAVTRGRRVSSSVLSSTVSLRWHWPAGAKALFAAGWFLTGLVIGFAGESWWWAFAAVLWTAGLLALRSNGECLLWAWDEIRNQDRKAPFVGRPQPLSGRDQRARLRDVSPGDWICDYEDHKIKLDEAEREYQRRRADRLADQQMRNSLRSATAPTTTRPATRYSSRGDAAPLAVPMSSGIPSREPQEDLPPIQRVEPAKDWMQVLSLVPTSEGNDVELGLLHRKKLTSPLERWYYRSPGVSTDGLQSEDPTLTELMRLLQSTDSAYRESEIISRLRGSGCSAVLIRRAIVAAVTVGLARRVRYPGWTAELLTGAFGLGERTSAGHRSCYLELTETGRAWLEAGSPKLVPRRPKWRLKRDCRYCGAPVTTAIKMFEDDPRCDLCGKFPGGNYISPEGGKY
jgi:hypothetical protein